MTKPPRKPAKLLREAETPLRSQPRRRRDAAQPQLPFDPMPVRVDPCLALLKQRPKGSDWVFEIKWDGYRLAVHVEPKGVRILTRGGHNWTQRFPTIAAAAKELPAATAIIDGVAVFLDRQGRSDFSLLQQSLGGRGGKKVSNDAVFYAFDLLYLDGHDLTTMTLDERRHMLDEIVTNPVGDIRLSEQLETDGAELLTAACRHGLEGIIAKNRHSPYRPGRFGDWVKVKCVQSDSFFIAGYKPSMNARGHIGRLLLAARKGNALAYVGSVGTGFKEREALGLREMMNQIRTRKSPLDYDGRHKDVVWLQPILIAEIEHRGWTGDCKLRHATYKGLREVQDNAVVFEIM
ncbi:non-homologous end-joining DNA ligase [Rhizobium laguerreae]